MSGISPGQQSVKLSAVSWRICRGMMRRLTLFHRRRVLARAQIQLRALRQCALSASDEFFCDKLVVSVDALLGNLQVRGIITLAERRALAHEWVKDYVRGRLPALYRDKNAHAIDRLGWFLQPHPAPRLFGPPATSARARHDLGRQ
jgi:hypothetical protein